MWLVQVFNWMDIVIREKTFATRSLARAYISLCLHQECVKRCVLFKLSDEFGHLEE